MKQKVVLFDIDYTLFDTDLFRKTLYDALSDVLKKSTQDTKVLAQSVYEESKKETGYFEPTVFIKNLFARLKTDADRKEVRKAIWNKKNFKECIYQESVSVVEQLSKIALVGIFSKGYNAFQRAKLATVQHLLDDAHIHITIDKGKTLPEVIKKYEGKKLYLADDALDVLHIAKQLDKHIFTIWVKRGRFAKTREPIAGFTPDEVVKDLLAIPEIINNR